MIRVSNRAVVAKVRPIGSMAAYYERSFDLMLVIGQGPEKDKKEVKSILNQIGYSLKEIISIGE